MEYPYCNKAGLSLSALLKGNIGPVSEENFTNGLVIELANIQIVNNLSKRHLLQWLYALAPSRELATLVKPSTLRAVINRLKKKKKKRDVAWKEIEKQTFRPTQGFCYSIKNASPQPHFSREAPTEARIKTSEEEFTRITLKASDGGALIFSRTQLEQESDYFRGLFNSGMRECEENEIFLPALSGIGLELTLEFLQSNTCSLTLENVSDVLNVASYLQMSALNIACCAYLIHSLTVSTYAPIKHIALEFDLHAVEESAEEFIFSHLVPFSETDVFLAFDQQELITFLKSDRIDVKTEKEVFDAAISWLRTEMRCEKVIEEVLTCVRFPLMTLGEKNECLAILESLTNEPMSKNHWIDITFGHKEASMSANVRAHKMCLLATGGFTCKEQSSNQFQFLQLKDLKSAFMTDQTEKNPTVQVVTRTEALSGQPTVRFQALKPTNLPVTLCEHGICTLDNYLYVAGGQTRYRQDGRYTRNAVYRYDPRHLCWTEMCPMQTQRSLFYLGELKGHLYAVAGWKAPEEATKSVERYIPQENRWEYVAPVHIGLHEHAGIGVAELTGCSLGKYLYVSGGYKGPMRGHLDTVLAFDPEADCWLTKASMLKARSYHVMIAHNNKLLVAGGVRYIGDDAFEDIRECEQYCPTMNQWTVVTSMPIYASCMDHVLYDGALYIFGGHSFERDESHSKVLKLDLTKELKWTEGHLASNSINFFACGVVAMPNKCIAKLSGPGQRRKSNFD